MILSGLPFFGEARAFSIFLLLLTGIYIIIDIDISKMAYQGGTDMNIVHWKYAVEVEKTRSISKAAETLHINPATLYRKMKKYGLLDK